ncbi:hypothetical protein [Salinirarus marinus]|uniref:hypothetical protein n=1 Tax=Salinirarus marinus TaxID=3068310 RepID=UPI003C6BE409
MSLRSARADDAVRPIVVECGLVAGALVGVFVWQRLVRRLTDVLVTALDGPRSLLLAGLLTGGLFVAGLALFVGGYVAYRDGDVGLEAPSRTDLPIVGLAALAPPVLVGVTKLVGVLTGVSYSSLLATYYRAGASLTPVLLVAGVGVLVTVPSLVLTCQLLVQRSFERVVGGRRAVVVTTLVTGFAMTSDTGGLTPVPDRGKLAGAILFVILLGVAQFVSGYVDRRRLRYLAYVPVVLFVAVVLVSSVAETESLADGVFTLTQLAVLAIAADAYERSDSLAVPALAYLSLSVSNYAVIVAFELGVRPA